MKTKNLMPSVILAAICLAAALLLAGINWITAPTIKDRQEKKALEALLEVLPEGENFKEITLTDDYPDVVTNGYTADGGYVFTMVVTGYKSGLKITCGIDSEGKIVGVKHLETNETYGFEAELNKAYIDDTLDNVELVLATGATKNSKTSKAYYEAIKAALQSAAIASGKDVDTRTPEQILQANCNAALGTSDVQFTKWFATEITSGVDAVYESAAGRVFVIGESFIGIKADGTVTTADATEENKAAALSVDTVIKNSSLTEITKPESASNNVKKIFVTESGNYVFELTANGYQSLIDWGNGTPINLKLSISSEGKIIDVLTVSHGESSGYGDVCQSEEYYAQYRGQGNEDIKISTAIPDYKADLISPDNTDIGAISSATYTTYGYQKAVKAAFEAYDILKGGNQ